ncbi:MAG: adenylyltransferase/cytidyltransferase family protein [Nanoarchaeota archaeon]
MITGNSSSYDSDNILSAEELAGKLEKLSTEGKKIGLCSGGFDLFHPGHITYLNSAKKFCDVLVVAVARDEFLKRKENGRPIFSERLRAYMVSQLKAVDFVIIDDGSVNTYYIIKPDVYIKGKDYADEKSVGMIESKAVLESLGAKIEYTIDEKFSSTDIIKKIKNID